MARPTRRIGARRIQPPALTERPVHPRLPMKTHSFRPDAARDRQYAALTVAVVAATILLRLAFQAYTRVTYEDSLISLRYAQNLANGAGLVYNVGERVFGASTPLYVLLLATLLKLGLPALGIAKTLAALADGATLYLWLRWLSRVPGGRWSGALFALLFGLSATIVPVSLSGMETSFALLFLTVALTADLEDRELLCGLGLGLLMLVRPDGALAAIVILGARAWRCRQVPWRAALPAALLVIPWVVTATLYYGTAIPNSIPAKAAAYNLHRPSWLPNFLDTLAQVAPTRGPWQRVLFTLVLCPCLLLGLREAIRQPRWRAVGILFPAWWLYLVLPRTLLFVWYLPLFVLPAYVLAAVGFGSLHAEPADAAPVPALRWNRWWSKGALLVVGVGAVGWLALNGTTVARVQGAEQNVRKRIGLWLRDNTLADARIAMEPIGYIGFYSGRRVLDEVGLVSPEMVPLNRAGDGWFTEMHRRFRPDYIVERPDYLWHNLTINSRVKLYRSQDELDEFLSEYEPVLRAQTRDVPKHLLWDYCFVIYARRTAESAATWKQSWSALPSYRRMEVRETTLQGLALRN